MENKVNKERADDRIEFQKALGDGNKGVLLRLFDKTQLLLKEARYYGSDLNKWIDENVSHNLTSINIDCMMVKIKKKKLRIIESKYPNEELKKGQRDALKILAAAFKLINEVISRNPEKVGRHRGWEFKVYLARGKPPYERLEITDLSNSKPFELKTKQQVAGWLSFEEINGE